MKKFSKIGLFKSKGRFFKESNNKLAQTEKDLFDVTEKYKRLSSIINKIGDYKRYV